MPNRAPWSHTASAQPGHELGGLLGAGVGGEVDVGGERAAEHRVADDPADEVEAVAGRVEALRQRAHLVEDRGAAAPGSPRKATRCPQARPVN